MNRTIDRLKIIFVGIFAVLIAAMMIYQFVWVEPAKRCAESHNWWDSASRECGKVIYIPAITGRPIVGQKPVGAAPVISPPR